ncbi:UDP-GlcNAc:betaGal beta-1,3-N-acetylglucosaminyltransferase-like protein 1 [Lucilia sericata]|uniref:UDP-GlcNAc:betaGal beta-1,3-N-acetylglucosaminyltransferase-like protein 1 n=1 Tax=Lucilia sericata TaxID=13632 RepID=UPI0018A7E9B9|nr:UDP-GlcNAc:betaGal beta-1,3-N-acetylglucosaminyltransferase-like protein 1 [Lucilia sericata]
MPEIEEKQDLISVIITVLNGGPWIDSCMESIIKQTAVQTQQQLQTLEKLHLDEAQNPFMSTMTNSPKTTATTATTPTHNLATSLLDDNDDVLKPLIEVCVFDDCSSDDTLKLLYKWQLNLRENFNIDMHIVENLTGKPKGVGYGRNRAIEAAKGNYLCFQDIDDEMLTSRIWKQYNLAKQYKNAIIGSKFIRTPSNSTCRFTRWANELSHDKLTIQIYTSNGPTIIMPTWLCHRQVYELIKGGFSEQGKGCPEDLIFFYQHLDNQGVIKRVEECLLKYRYHAEATTFSVAARTIWHIRLSHLLENVLRKPPWSKGFSIWNAGKQGRKFFRDLPPEEKKKVKTFCDVDKNKIHKLYKYYDAVLRQITFSIPIVHFSVVEPPVVICMKLDLTNGDFEMNLQSLQFEEGKDYILFT